MKVQSLTLHGFKSFADRTEIDFHAGTTAIVGPNGCGKSNISDAFRWVLGEQRPTAIRGSRMEEAIFQGTAERRPIHRAEVSLTLSNEDGVLPVPWQEVVIGREVLRGGDSAYRLNGEVCRLRDILDLFRDTGLGANAYSVIEGRMVDAILSDRAEERRALFEEAAEIGRYKDRRRTALRRLEQAEGDLSRLEDLLGEVRSKVRSLARQRGRARRYRELRERRLTLEVAVAEARLERIEGRLAAAGEELSRHRESRPGKEALLQTRETEAETLRLAIVERERERAETARALESVRERLEGRERERLVARERIAAAEARVGTIREERARLADRMRELEQEIEAAEADLGERRRELASRREELTAHREAAEGLRTRREEAARREREALRQVEEAMRRLGAREAEAAAATERRRERIAERERRREELGRVEAELADLESAVAAADREVAAARATLEARAAELERLREEEARSREQAREAREALAALEGEISAVAARAEGLAGMLAGGSDLPPVVGELLERRDRLPGVLGTLADSLSVPAALAPAVEGLLGPLLHAVLVRDAEAVRGVRRWLGAREEPEGLYLLPVEPGPRAEAVEAPLLEEIAVEGPGETWARALLAGVRLRETADPASDGEGAWVTPDGSGRDRLGVVRIGRPGGGAGVLSRRAELERLRTRRRELDEQHREAELELGRRAERRREVERRAEAAEAELRRSAESLRRAESEAAGIEERRERLRARRGEVAERIAALEDAIAETESAVPAGEDPAALQAALAEAEGRLAEARERAAEAAARWDEEAEALRERELAVARGESAVAALEERVGRLGGAREEAGSRDAGLAREADERRAAAAADRERMESGESALESLFEERARLEERAREHAEWLASRKAELEERESELRAVRREEREAAERRHALELEIAELRGQRATTRERLEAEWEESFEELRARVPAPEEGGPEAWSAELEEVRRTLASLGPVNLLAAEEWEEERERLDFLEGQKEDLEAARRDLLDSIRRINESASTAFLEVFEEVRRNFRRIFVTLFEGGECDLWLEDEEDPLDAAIEISASPRGKRTQRIHLLSGGERALTALALLFAIYLTKPSPFCIMDEVDAPLDETNIGRFTAMLDRFKDETQFIVITHNPRTIEAADWIYGVTMQEPGVTSVVSVELRDLPRGQVA